MITDHLKKDRLGKILALVDSDFEGEAVAALRRAKQIMFNSGISFADLIQSTKPPKDAPSNARYEINKLSRLLTAAHSLVKKKDQEIRNYRCTTKDLECRVSALEKELTGKKKESDGWRDRAWRILWEKEKEISELKRQLEGTRCKSHSQGRGH